MNGLEIIVLGTIILSGFMGYRTGFLRVVYSLVSWILVLGVVTWANPYVTGFLEKNTSLQESIQQKCVAYIEQNAAEKIAEQTEEAQEEQKNSLQDAGILIPENIIGKITDSATESANEMLLSSGIYDQIAQSIAHFILEGIAFFASLIIAGMIVKAIAHMLDLVSHLPVIHGANKTLGIAAGVVKGFAIVWLAFYILMLCVTSELGMQLYTYVEESPILLYLYNNNILVQLIMAFL